MMFIPKLLQFVVAIVGATLLFWVGLYAGFWWDNRPAGQPSIVLHVGPFPVHWTAPESLRARLEGYLQAQKAALLAKAATEAREAAISAAAGAAEAQAQQIIVTRYKTLQKEVPVYVTQQSDNACVVPFGFVSLLNAAAAGGDMSPVAPPSGQSNDSPSGLKLSAVADSVVGNYGAATGNAKQLSDLQQWLKDQGMNP